MSGLVRLGRDMGRTHAPERGLAEAKGEFPAVPDPDDARLAVRPFAADPDLRGPLEREC